MRGVIRLPPSPTKPAHAILHRSQQRQIQLPTSYSREEGKYTYSLHWQSAAELCHFLLHCRCYISHATHYCTAGVISHTPRITALPVLYLTRHALLHCRCYISHATHYCTAGVISHTPRITALPVLYLTRHALLHCRCYISHATRKEKSGYIHTIEYSYRYGNVIQLQENTARESSQRQSRQTGSQRQSRQSGSQTGR